MVSSDGVAENWDVVIGLKMQSCSGPIADNFEYRWEPPAHHYMQVFELTLQSWQNVQRALS